MAQEPMQPTTDSHREAMEEAVNQYEVAALVSGEVEQYLSSRGLEDQTARSFRLGLVEDPLPGHSRYVGKLVIPYLHPTGYPLTVRFRCIADHGSGPGKDCRSNGHGKYLTMSDDPSRMFNVGAIIKAGSELHVTEGEFDAMVLEQLGYPAIAIPGVNAWKPHYRNLMLGFSKIHVWGDPDDAGADFVNHICRVVPRAAGVRVKVGDVTETYLAGGAAAIEALVA